MKKLLTFLVVAVITTLTLGFTFEIQGSDYGNSAKIWLNSGSTGFNTQTQDNLTGPIIQNTLSNPIFPNQPMNIDAWTFTYTYASSTATYTALTTPTQIFTNTQINTGTVSAAIPLGHTFYYNGVAYTSAYVSSHGFITFGSAPTSTNYTPISLNEGSGGVISAFASQLTSYNTSARVDYKDLTASNEFVFQWSEMQASGNTSNRVSFQIRLNYSTHVITVIYGGTIASSSTNSNYYEQVGLRGATNADFDNVSAGAGGSWNPPTTHPGASNTAVMRFRTGSNGAGIPTSGRYLTWTPPSGAVCLLTPTSNAYGNQNIGTQSANQTFTITNGGLGTLTIASGGITLTGTNASEFVLTDVNSYPISLATGQTATVQVKFAPTTAGAKTASLQVVSNATTKTSTLTGTGVGPTCTFSPTTKAFGNQGTGTQSADQPFTITNTGGGTMTITAGQVALIGTNASEFILTDANTYPQDLTNGQSITVNVKFAPSTSGAKTASLQVTSTATNSPTTAALTGTGILIISSFPYQEPFESSNGSWISGQIATANTWAWGTPSGKTQILTANGGSGKCWVTNLTGTYTSSEESYLMSPGFNFTSITNGVVLKYYQNFYQESAYDACVVEYTTNGGTNWTRVDNVAGTGANFSTTNSFNWYNRSATMTGGPIAAPNFNNTSTAYLGHTNGWIQTTTKIASLAGYTGTVFFRFHFGCDGSVNYDGTAIDDISISDDGVSTFYYIGTGNFNSTLNWFSNANGTGTNPSNFTNSGITYNIIKQGTTAAYIMEAEPWIISGTGSKVVLGDATNAVDLTIPSGATFATTQIDVQQNSALHIATINTPTVPTLGTLNSTSTVEFSSTAAQTIPAVIFGNLISSSSGVRTLASTGITGISGTFNPGGSNTYMVAGSTINFNSTGAQTIPAFNYNNLISSSTGSRTLASSSTIGIAGTFTPGTNAYTITGSTFNFKGTKQTIPAFNYYNLTNSGTDTTTLANTGTIGIAGTFTPGTSAYSVTGSTVTFNGTIVQTIPDITSAYNNLTLNDSTGLSLGSGIAVNGILTLTAGKLLLGNYDLTLGLNATISGTPSATRMVVADNAIGSGKVNKVFPIGSSAAFTYPIGDSAGNYTPAQFTFSANSTQRTLGVWVKGTSDLHGGTYADYIKRYWNVTNSSSANSFTAAANFTFVPADVVGTIANCDASVWNGTSWLFPGSAISSTNISIPSFSEMASVGSYEFTCFTGIVSNPNLLLPANNANGVSITPLLDWSDVTRATSYRVQVSTSNTFATMVWDSAGITTSQANVPAGKLTGMTQYYWRVEAANTGGTSGWSSVFSFTTLQNLSLNLKVYLEGFWNGAVQVSDTATVYLANSTTPFAFADSAKVVLSASGTASVNFTKAPNGSYYIVVNHRNHLETWSRLAQTFVTNAAVNYNFTTAVTQAFGSNMKQVGTVWVLYGGDANRDGYIDAFDITILIAENGGFGYLGSDFNGDGFVDALDIPIIIANNGLAKYYPALLNNPNGQININSRREETKEQIKKVFNNNTGKELIEKIKK
jgi:hypothetical protein